ncbi:MAG: hypothetical protein CL447_06445 [Acidimicrobiaceae bacterium]|nr:hypothetical protein [Acidimicrobiaceae bacterium]
MFATGVTTVSAAPGDLDTGFASGSGYATPGLNWKVNGIAVQPDGKYLLVGENDYDFAVARLNADGTLDTTFGGGDGEVVTAISAGGAEARSVAIDDAQNIVVAGWAHDNVSNYDTAVVRYDSSGNLDTAFGNNGITITQVTSDNDRAYALKLQSDGKILLAGESRIGGNYYFSLLRYTSAGALDTTFGSSGISTVYFNGNSYGRSLEVDSQGRILVGGHAFIGGDEDYALARFDSGGALDATFGSSGKVTTELGSYDRAIAVRVQSDGKIVLMGDSYNGNSNGYDFAAVRYSDSGAVDSTFGTSGVAEKLHVGPDADVASAGVMQDGGEILIAGTSGGYSDSGVGLVRYATNGVADTSFSDDGKASVQVDSRVGTVRGMALDGNGFVLVAGYTVSDPMMGSDYEAFVARFQVANSPEAPTGVTATAGNGEATVSWTAPSDDGGSAISGFEVTSTPDGLTCQTTDSISCVITGLSNGTSYTFTVVATNGAGSSAASAPSDFITPTAPNTTTTAAPTTTLDAQPGSVPTPDPQTLPATGRTLGSTELYVFVLLAGTGAMLARVARRSSSQP